MRRVLTGGLTVALLLCGSGCGNSGGASDTTVLTGFQVEATGQVTTPALPSPGDDRYTALGNTRLEVSFAEGVFLNDQVGGARIVSFDATSNSGGQVSLADDGSFTYTPPSGFRGDDTFSYTLKNVTGQGTATVTVSVPSLGLFVDNSVTVNGDGSLDQPFDNLPEALNMAAQGDLIFVFAGDGSETNQGGAFALPEGVDLIGEAEGLVFGRTLVEPGGRPVLNGPVTLGGTNTLAGLSFQNSTDDGVVADGVDNLVVRNNSFQGAAQGHLDLDDMGGSVSLTDNSFGPTVGDGEDWVDIEGTGVETDILVSGNTFTDDDSTDPDDALDVEIHGAGLVNLTITDNSFSSSDQSAAFNNCVDINANGTSRLAITVSDNTMTQSGSTPVRIDCDDSGQMSGEISGNIVDSFTSDGIRVESGSSGPRVRVSGNVIRNGGDDGFDLNATDTSGNNPVVLLENNNISTMAEDGVDITSNISLADSVVTVLLRENTVSGVTQSSVDIDLLAAGRICVDLVGNTLGGDADFLDMNSSGGIDVEQFSLLGTLNTFLSGSPSQGSGNDVTEREDGFCVSP